MDAWPRSVCTALMSAHFLISDVAKLCLSVCGVTFLSMPASLAYFFTISSIAFLLRCSPNLFADRLMNRYGELSVLVLRYSFSFSLASLVVNIALILEPLPITENCLLSTWTSFFCRLINSETLSPVPYKNWRIASSLISLNLFLLNCAGADKIFSISSSAR